MKRKSESFSSLRQHTLKSNIHCSGVGLHSGQKLTMSLYAAGVDTGIVFRRTDVQDGCNEITARFDNVGDIRLCTTLINEDGVTIGTVEHLMAALAGCEIDNAVVELNGPEVPIMDGSAGPFVCLIESAGIVEQAAPRRAIEILRRVHVANGNAEISLEPSSGFSINLGIDFAHPSIGQQNIVLDMTSAAFKSQICRARTFGFLHEVESLRTAGFGLGGSLDNAVVISADGVMNEEGLRFADEFVRHKVLDCIGDLYLLGAPIQGRVRGRRNGHSLNNLLLRTLIADRNAWRLVALDKLGAQTPPPHTKQVDWQEQPLAALA
jgi:UDP-3-O-[3-hydroxymyristoyl] N-acetylglucosamine deacetylase